MIIIYIALGIALGIVLGFWLTGSFAENQARRLERERIQGAKHREWNNSERGRDMIAWQRDNLSPDQFQEFERNRRLEEQGKRVHYSATRLSKKK